jgi:ABC-type spermidine/putrescine transport system permease subunit II
MQTPIGFERLRSMTRLGGTILPAGLLPVLIYLSFMLVAPLGVLVVYSFWKADFFSVTRTFTLENYERLGASPLFIGILGKTLFNSLVVSCITVVVAYAMAYTIVFKFRVWGPRIFVLVMASLLSSYIVRLYALTTILGTNGILNKALMGLALTDKPLDFLLYGYPAIVITLIYVYLPIAVLPICASLQGIDRRLLEASRDLGLGPARTFLRITLPLSARGSRTAFAFCFILAASDYVAPRLVGGMDGQMLGSIIADQFGGASNYPFGATLSVAMVLGFGVVLVGCYALERVVVWAARRPFWRKLGGFSPPSIPDLRLAEIITLLALVFLFAPLLTVFVFSFNDAPNPGLPFVGFTGHWYADVVESWTFHQVLGTSLTIGMICVAGAMFLGFPAAVALARRRFALRGPASLAIFAPMAVPGVVIGVALLATFVTLGIRLGVATTAAAHVMLVLPFVVQVIRTRLDKIDPRIEEAARDLGSSPIRVMSTVTLPISTTAILGAGILAAAISLDELLVTNFIIGSNATVPVWIASQMRIGLTPALNAVAILMLAGSLGAIGLTSYATRLRRNRRWAVATGEVL